MNLVKKTNGHYFPSVFDELFRPDFGGRQMNFNAPAVPPVNIKETEAAFEVELSAPGKQKQDFNIEIDNGLLTISSEIKSENNVEEGKYTRREFSFASFKRSFTLPESVNDSEIKAAYEAGVLKIFLPKKDEALPKAKRVIEVND
ncbi:Hsp20/alpha crystallin family protein [Flavobacterium selenitireducens]|uniref:Hsp20/alpha crystallin family protein n=1 Tax=Flavobacterium selenitireducens TaxID=2722704 RepID=UPI00168BD9ED|nr:Hsp20/alpha crystallin family protein [Flavobacterium selenitireducens]MBD3582555.1 Hsp20/alpha crystallin family protein [Flavobacterium selenitireducens]